MTNQPANNQVKKVRNKNGQFAAGSAGGPGRPAGSRNQATLIAQSQMAEHLPEIIDKVIENALAGDTTAQKIVIERLVPVCRDRPIKVELPGIVTADDLPKAGQAILKATANGDITPSESLLMARLLTNHVKLLEISEIEARLKRLEDRTVN